MESRKITFIKKTHLALKPNCMLGMSLLNFLGLVALTSLLLATSCEAYSSSRNCQFNRHLRTTNISNCKYGWEVDACGNKICAKGPGELCGGKHMRYGICGEGLMCSNCNRCQGCSLKTYECFDDSKCIRY